ncbi:MAG: TIGR01548 family HAD-type hydrolase [Xenococcaceae cyanobacterium]
MLLKEEFKAIVVFDIDGVVRDVANSYRRAIADTVEHFTTGLWRPTPLDIDRLKSEGVWNNDWFASRELIYRYFDLQGQQRSSIALNYDEIVEFFQSRYRGNDRLNWNGYITTEPLLMTAEYTELLTNNHIGWGFFSGATRGSAEYVLVKRIGLKDTVLVAMEDAPGKPDPTGLIDTVDRIEKGTGKARDENRDNLTPVIYVGDTVADMYTVIKATQVQPKRKWIGVGILPPHVQSELDIKEAYTNTLTQAGAAIVYGNVQELTPSQIEYLVN